MSSWCDNNCAPLCCSAPDPAGCMAVLNAAPSLTTQSPQALSCAALVNVLDVCGSLSPGFSTFSPEKQASCACFSGVNYRPDLWDSLALPCYSYQRTTNTQSALLWSSRFVGWCSSHSPLRAVPTGSSITSSVSKHIPFAFNRRPNTSDYMNSLTKLFGFHNTGSSIHRFEQVVINCLSDFSAAPNGCIE